MTPASSQDESKRFFQQPLKPGSYASCQCTAEAVLHPKHQPLNSSRLFVSVYGNRLMIDATYPAPKPLSMFTTETLDAQEFSIPSSADRPWNDAP